MRSMSSSKKCACACLTCISPMSHSLADLRCGACGDIQQNTGTILHLTVAHYADEVYFRKAGVHGEDVGISWQGNSGPRMGLGIP